MASACRVVITAVGAATSLGGAITAAAGFRAGLSRPAALDEWKVLDAESGDSVPVNAHAVEAVAGFHNPGRLAFLAALGLSDIRRSLSEPLSRIQLVLGVPDFVDRFLAMEELSEEDRRDAEQKFATDARHIALQATVHAGLGFRPEEVHVLAISAAGFSSALGFARELLEERSCDRVVVGAVDSLIDADLLEVLHDADRLKTPEVPTGTTPGEASAFLCLERDEADALASPTILARLGAIGSGQTQDHRTSDHPPSGAAWAAAGLAALGSAGGQPLLLVQHNGESHSAQEWGQALVHLQQSHAAMRFAVSWYPGVAFGDVGTAFSPLAMVLACRAWARRHAPSSTAMVMAGSDVGLRAAIRLDAPPAGAIGAQCPRL